MNTRLLIVVAATCFCITACKNHQTDEPDTDRVVYLADSVYRYSIDADSVESLVQLTYFTYDANGNMTLEFDSVIAPQSPYSASKSKIEMQYDEKGNIIVEQISSYNPRSESWNNGQRNVYEYDAKNKLSVETIYLGYSGPLENPSKKICYSWIDDTHASCLGYMYDRAVSETDPWRLSEKIAVQQKNICGALQYTNTINMEILLCLPSPIKTMSCNYMSIINMNMTQMGKCSLNGGERVIVTKKIENTLRNTFISINRLPLRYTYCVVYSS